MRISEVCIVVLVVVSVWNEEVVEAQGRLRRCFQCRSRGDLGSCKDPFKYTNATQIEKVRGIQAVPCASGWCGKVIEGGQAYASDDYDVATQRMCVQRGPSDSEDRCAHTIYNHKKVFMCFCQGDLCNASTRLYSPPFILLATSVFAAIAAGHILIHQLRR